MASINASTTGVGGIITTADNTGILQLQSAGVTAMTIDASQNITFTNTPSASAMTLLATINTTSGTSVNSGTVNLTSYKQVMIVFNAVSTNGTTGNFTMTDPNATVFNLINNPGTAVNGITGSITIDLASGVIFGTMRSSTTTTLPDVPGAGGSVAVIGGKTTFSTASTIFTFGSSAGAFDAGSILVYGVR